MKESINIIIYGYCSIMKLYKHIDIYSENLIIFLSLLDINNNNNNTSLSLIACIELKY